MPLGLFKTKLTLLLLAMLLLLSLILSGCAVGVVSGIDTPRPATGKQDGEETIKVATTISVLANFIGEVGGDRVVVRNIVPTARDPHTFQPSPQDVRVVSESKVVFVNGMGLEGPLENLARSAAKPDAHFVVLSEGLELIAEARHDEASVQASDDDHSAGNPHLWLNPRLAQQYVRRIQRELAEVDPSGKAVYERNAADYLAELAELDAWIESQIATIPNEKRKLVTFHDAFPYFTRRYGLKLVGVVLRSPEREPSAREVAELVDTIRREEVKTVFAEPQLNARILEIVAREAGVKIAILYSDSTDDNVATYAALMRYNTEQIVAGLR